MFSAMFFSSVLLGVAAGAGAGAHSGVVGAGPPQGVGGPPGAWAPPGAVEGGAPFLQTEDLEEPPYTVVAQHEGFEERLYPARRWATFTMEGPAGGDTAPVWDAMFPRLFQYISGRNDKRAIIPMTAPVTTQVLPHTSGSMATFFMGFYVPEDMQADVPGGDGITVEDRPQMTVFTRRFGGHTSDEIVAKEAGELAALISASPAGADVDLSTYFVAGYDDPRKTEGRRNEVWYYRV